MIGGAFDYFVPDGFMIRFLGQKRKRVFVNAVLAGFMMAGVAADHTEFGLLWSNIGRRTAIWLPVITVPEIVLYGWALNQFAAS